MEGGFDHAGGDGVDPDFAGGQIAGHVAGEIMNIGLGAGIVARTRAATIGAGDGATLMMAPPPCFSI